MSSALQNLGDALAGIYPALHLAARRDWIGAVLQHAAAEGGLRACAADHVSDDRLVAAQRASRAARMMNHLVELLLDPARLDVDVAELSTIADRVLAAAQGKGTLSDFALIELVRMVEETAQWTDIDGVQLWPAWSYFAYRYPTHAERITPAAVQKAAVAWLDSSAKVRFVAVTDLAIAAGILTPATTWEAVRKQWQRWDQ